MTKEEKFPGDLWDKVGSLEDIETMQVLTRLFDVYELQLQNNPQDGAAQQFFKYLEQAIAQASECNLNRR
ncbi:hypothetical protein [Desulfosediminicola flagellatus]|uniref:hypothetical protein n=1 Tax=Desulfosediminicola flagellatus TaxID=2569541 RepID=UPI0010AD0B4C|nr:hypothetical protein [Desulfosediminicola flagellatus]